MTARRAATVTAPPAERNPTAPPPPSAAECQVWADEYGRAFAEVFLWRHADLTLQRRDRHRFVPLDLSAVVGASKPDADRAGRLEIAVECVHEDGPFARPERAARSFLKRSEWRALAGPALLILVQARAEEMKYRWLLRPTVNGDGRPELNARGNGWSPLDPAALDGIVAEVAAWYDAARRDRLAAA